MYDALTAEAAFATVAVRINAYPVSLSHRYDRFTDLYDYAGKFIAQEG